MRKSAVFFLAFAVSAPLLCAQPKYSDYAVKCLREDPGRAAGNLHPYEFLPVSDTPAPAGYQAFYISHYGRHGSRSDDSVKKLPELIGKFAQMKKEKALTDEGLAVLEELKSLLDSTGKMSGRLSPRGAREHAILAQRMFRRFPSVLSGAKYIRSVSSTVPRCLVSQNSFTMSLMGLNPALNISLDCGDKYQGYLTMGPSKEATEKIKKATKEVSADVVGQYKDCDTLHIREVLFRDEEASRYYFPNARKLMRDLYSNGKLSPAFDVESHILYDLPFDYLYYQLITANNWIYLGHANSIEAGDIRVKFAQALVRDIVSKADEAISGGKYAADLRFGHDLPLLACLCYFQFSGVGDRIPLEKLHESWLSFRMMPPAANLQMILFRNQAGDVLVKFLYNEQESTIPGLTAINGVYYRWSDVKDRLAAREASLK